MKKLNKIIVVNLFCVTVTLTTISLIETIYKGKALKADCAHEIVEHYTASGASGGLLGHVEHYACCSCHTAWQDEKRTIKLSDDSRSDRSKIDTYDIAWVDSSGKAGLFFNYYQKVKSIIFNNDNYDKDHHCGETENDLISYNWDDTNEILTISSKYRIRFENDDMPWGCSFFPACSKLEYLDLENIDVSSTTDFQYFCSGDSKLKTIDNFEFIDTLNSTSFTNFFSGCSSLTSIDLTHLNTSKATNTSSMFEECSALTSLDLSSFYTPLLENTECMFYSMSFLTTIYANDNFIVSSVEEDLNMFYGCENLKGGKETCYDSSRVGKDFAHIDYGSSNPGYFTEKN